MEIFQAIKSRKSVRVYSEKNVDKALIEKIIDAGRVAATARNEQPWEFVVTKNKEILKRIGVLCPNGTFAKDADSVICVFSKDTKYYIEDCSAATQNMLVAIEALGLGGCWIAGDKKDYAGEIGKMFGAPEGYRLVSMISLGYPKSSKDPKPKKELKDLLHWEKW